MIEFRYICDQVPAFGACEVAVIAIARYGWVVFRECVDLLYKKKLKEDILKNYVHIAILYGCRA